MCQVRITAMDYSGSLTVLKKVLIADDDLPILDLLTEVIKTDCGAEVFVAHDGEAAWEIVRRERPDLVLSDVRMPKLGGLELCRQLKSDPESRGITVILISAVHDLDTSSCEADCYLRKPFDINILSETVLRFLNKVA